MTVLTNREREVVELLAQGKRQVDIARILCIEVDTVWKHVASAKRKTGNETTTQMAIKAAGVFGQR